MDANDKEINGFITKFKQLWKDGFQAHLNLDSCGGKAWVGIRLHLDNSPAYTATQKRHAGTARERRRAKGAAVNKAKDDLIATEASSHCEATEEVVIADVERKTYQNISDSLDHESGRQVDDVRENINEVAATENVDIGKIIVDEIRIVNWIRIWIGMALVYKRRMHRRMLLKFQQL